MKKLICSLLSAVLVLGMCACSGNPAPAENPVPATTEARVSVNPVPDTFVGLVLTAEPGVELSLFGGFDKSFFIKPTEVYEEWDQVYYCYAELSGAYCCQATGDGYYSVSKNISMTQEKANTKTVIDMTPDALSGGGWEPLDVTIYTDELLNGPLNADISQWPDYADGFTTPYFTQEHGAHQITTQDQMEAFLQDLDDKNDNLYLYDTGTSGEYNHRIPLVIFTTADLSGADTVEAAAAAMDNGKPTIFFRAQIHGNEPASCEAALAVIRLLDSTWAQYLEQMNICVLPRNNPDGAQTYQRLTVSGVNGNRDCMQIRAPETEIYIKLCQVLDPQIIIDGHESDPYPTNNSQPSEMLVGLGYTNNNTDQFRDLMLSMSKEIFSDLTAKGLTSGYYTNKTNTNNANISRGYAAHQGTLFILLESQGIGCGLTVYPRRIVSYVISVESILDYTAQNAEQICNTVTKEKQNIIDKGAVYDENDRIILETGKNAEHSLTYVQIRHDQETGLPEKVSRIPEAYNVVVNDRIAPTAYVIPAGERTTEAVLELMDKHGIAYTFIPEGSQVQLQQYTTKESGLLDETTVTFSKGAYVFCKNQVQGNILSLLMEPDVEDLSDHAGTLVQQQLITATGVDYPIYRYIHDLNEKGFIDYR